MKETNAKLNKDFALILDWDFFSAYKHIRKTDCALAIGWSTLVFCFEKHLIDLCESVKWAESRVAVCIPDRRQVQLKREVIESSEKNICAREWESWQSAWLPHIVWYSGWFMSYNGMSPWYAIAYLHKNGFFHLHLSPK